MSHENRIRDLAYQIWESEGRPHGQDARHWNLASKLAAEDVESGFANPGFDSPTQAVSETPIGAGTIPSKAKARKSSITSQGAAVSSQQQAETKPAKPVRKPAKSKSNAPQMN
ncbi:MAG TPA: DUF2934 domain-containing protein [Candidatus Angelobacter sp.]|jgi:hypothetical protein|nr:DUF2934 domain-containing protein [Candidatus Angelobacter sp.]